MRQRFDRVLTAVYAGLAAGFAVSTVRRLAAPGGMVATDFSVFRTGWWLILHGQAVSLYDAAAQRAAQRVVMHGAEFEGGLMAFLNPPHAALAGVPFGWIAERAGERTAFLSWAAVNVVLLATLARWLIELAGARRTHDGRLVTFALLAFSPVWITLQLGQLSLLLAVAVLGLYRAIDRDCPATGAAWLLVLSAKPQLLLPLLVFVAVRRHIRMLGWAASLAVAVAAVTTVVLGGSIWVDYARSVRELEAFWGSGTPGYMLNVRGAATRMTSLDAHTVAVVSFGLLLVSSLLLAVLLASQDLHARRDVRVPFAMAVAVALLFSPHLFPQDAVIWAIPAVVAGGAVWLIPLVAALQQWPSIQFVTYGALLVTVALRLRDGTSDEHLIRSAAA